jgi:hypothetical protein
MQKSPANKSGKILKKGGRMYLGCSQKLPKKVGDACPQGAFKNHQKNGGGRMTPGCSQKMLKKHVCLCLLVFFAIMQHFSDCDGNAIFRISSNKIRNLHQFLSTSDAI